MSDLCSPFRLQKLMYIVKNTVSILCSASSILGKWSSLSYAISRRKKNQFNSDTRTFALGVLINGLKVDIQLDDSMGAAAEIRSATAT